jgi:hypothetical protein
MRSKWLGQPFVYGGAVLSAQQAPAQQCGRLATYTGTITGVGGPLPGLALPAPLATGQYSRYGVDRSFVDGTFTLDTSERRIN